MFVIEDSNRCESVCMWESVIGLFHKIVLVLLNSTLLASFAFPLRVVPNDFLI